MTNNENWIKTNNEKWIEELFTPIEEIPPPKPISSGPLYVDRAMVENPIAITAVNETQKVWVGNKCLPATFWVKRGQRIADAPSTKDQPLQFDVRPGEFITFLVLVPRLPAKVKPDALRISVLENGVTFHRIMDIPFR